MGGNCRHRQGRCRRALTGTNILRGCSLTARLCQASRFWPHGSTTAQVLCCAPGLHPRCPVCSPPCSCVASAASVLSRKPGNPIRLSCTKKFPSGYARNITRLLVASGPWWRCRAWRLGLRIRALETSRARMRMSLHQSVGRTSLRRDLIAAKKAIERDSLCKYSFCASPVQPKGKSCHGCHHPCHGDGTVDALTLRVGRSESRLRGRVCHVRF